MQDTREAYMNDMQQRIHFAGAKDVRLTASRRFGKTDGCIGPRMWDVTLALPRSTNIILCTSRKQGYTRTIPGMIAAIERFFRVKEGVHFGWGRPPKGIPSPILKPKTYDNVLWFANGTIWQVISLAIPGSANGLSVTSIIADECKFMSKGAIDAEVMPTLSGITHPDNSPDFSDYNPLYKSTFFASDASLTAKGSWLEREEEKLDLEIADGKLKGKTYRWVQNQLDRYARRCMYFNDLDRRAKKANIPLTVVRPEERDRIRALADAVMAHSGPFKILPNYGKHINKATCQFLVNYQLVTPDDAELLYAHEFLITPDEHTELCRMKESKDFARALNTLRCNAFCCYRASTLDNLDILGMEYILQMKRDLPPLIFAISILNLKVKKVSDGFYSNLDVENVHGYIPDDCPAIDNNYTIKGPDFARLESINDCTKDGDVVDGLELHVAFDWGSIINWIVTGQLYKRDGKEALNVLSSMYVKDGALLQDLVVKWCLYYEPHRLKCNKVFFYFDQTAKVHLYAVSNEDFKDTVIKIMREHGWDVIIRDMGAAPKHEIKHKVINESLAEVSYPVCRFNRENNEALLIAMENTGIQIGYNGFHKDKSGEKLTTSAQAQKNAENIVPAELRTDGTDAFDSLFWGVKFHRFRLAGMRMPRPN